VGEQVIYSATRCCQGRCCVPEGNVPAGVTLRPEQRICRNCNHVVWPAGVVVRTPEPARR
jgi:hypothetical protein